MCSWNAGCPKNLVETSLWKAWVWVAWIDRGQQILDTEKLQWKVIRIHHWFTTQTWTLTISRWIATPDSIIHPYRQPWCLHEVNGFAIKNSANGFLKQACRTNLFAAVGHIWRTRAAEKAKTQFFIASWLWLHGNMGPTSKDAMTMFELDCDSPLNNSTLPTTLMSSWGEWLCNKE